jgi:hypothetical protein
MNASIKRLFLAGLSAACLSTAAWAGSNPLVPFYGSGGTIVADPHYPIVGENTHFQVVVSNDGSDPATNVQLKLSFNDWGVTYQGWQEIGVVTIPSIPAGGSVTAEFDHVFNNRTHTCIEALIIGSDEDSNPDDDRGQINLEVINSGDTFSYGVPVRNNGDGPVNLLLIGNCKDAQGGRGCEPVKQEVALAPGEEKIVDIHLNLAGTAPGQEVDFILDAFDMNAGPAAFNPANHNHVHLKIRRDTARRLTKAAMAAVALARTQTVGNDGKKMDEIVKHLDQALKAKVWTDDNHLAAGGAQVFAHDADASKELLRLLDGNLDPAAKAVLDEATRNLADAARILAQSAGANSQSPSLDAGDIERAAGEYVDAIQDYKAAWQAASH